MGEPLNIFWFRRDLRLNDNTALFHALDSVLPVLPVFIFDKKILNQLEPDDKRVSFIYHSLADLQEQLKHFNSSLFCIHDTPQNAFRTLIEEYDIKAIYTNDDYEPYARNRDAEVKDIVNIPFHSFKDHVIFHKDDIVKDNGKPYTIFTPYSRKWNEKLSNDELTLFKSEDLLMNFVKIDHPLPTLQNLGFDEFPKTPDLNIDDDLIARYAAQRDIPSLNATTRAGIHLRFGTISIRELVRKSMAISETFLNELIWREFYQSILWHFPHVTTLAFKPAFDNIPWRNNEEEFEKWCAGQTGYPVVDAGMRQLNETGFMHNRVRMITASFLCKHLLIDWRWGEAYFAGKLLDYELASNNGGWQWAAGSGCDAVPFFRIFNPYLQAKKFDPGNVYIRKWVPEFQSGDYPQPLVDHEFARKRCLEVYKKAINPQ